ncbi:GGDEF domain-containing protein, partial [Helicobacter canadensis]
MKEDLEGANLPNFESNGIEEKPSSFDSIPSFDSTDSNSSIQSQEELKPANDDSIESYGTQVIQALLSNGIPPTPCNYKIYFEKLLEDKPQDFKNNAMQFLQAEFIPSEKQALLENKVLKAQNYMVSTLRLVGALFSNFQLLQNILKKHEREIDSVQNANILQNVITLFEKELKKIGEISTKQLKDIKMSYDKTAMAIDNITQEIICDSRYNIYNQRFLETKVQMECQESAIDKHKSSLLLLKITKNLEKKVTSEKNAILINKTITKILQKIANRSDILAYYGEGIFGLLLNHRDKESAKRFANNLSEKVVETNIYLGDEELSLSICSGICEINEKSKSK